MEQEYINGDIVMYDNKIHIIIDAVGLNNYELSCVNYPIKHTELSGVPITPEILEKNEWEHKDDVYFKEYPHRKLVVMDGNAYIINESCSLFLRKIEFVHELQHLLFGLKINHEIKV